MFKKPNTCCFNDLPSSTPRFTTIGQKLFNKEEAEYAAKIINQNKARKP